jgi:CheY-like chemotaxis protein
MRILNIRSNQGMAHAKCVLIEDDSRCNRRSLVRCWKNLHYEGAVVVRWRLRAGNGANPSADLVILDIMLPKMDG